MKFKKFRPEGFFANVYHVAPIDDVYVTSYLLTLNTTKTRLKARSMFH